VDAINAAQDRVRASVYYDGTNYKLMLSENDVGASTVETDTTGGVYVISVSGLPSELGTGLDTVQKAQNAEIVLGSGSPITSPSNKVTSFLNDFVSKYNGLVQLVDSLTVGDKALFRGDYTIGSVKTGIAERLEPLIAEGLIDYNGDTGEISLRTDKLNERNSGRGSSSLWCPSPKLPEVRRNEPSRGLSTEHG